MTMSNIGKTLVLFFFVRLLTAAPGASCKHLEGKPSSAQAEYLQGDRAALLPACVVFAIERIGNERYKPASETLAKYLDFAPAADPKTVDTVARIHTASFGEIYPAFGALYKIGVSAVPAVVEAISDSSSSEPKRDLGIWLLVAIYREKPEAVVTALIRAARSVPDAAKSAHLTEAAYQAASRCLDRDKSACHAALR